MCTCKLIWLFHNWFWGDWSLVCVCVCVAQTGTDANSKRNNNNNKMNRFKISRLFSSRNLFCTTVKHIKFRPHFRSEQNKTFNQFLQKCVFELIHLSQSKKIYFIICVASAECRRKIKCNSL